MEAGKVRNLPRLERAVGCNKVRKGVVRSMYLYLDKQEFFFWHFTVKKTRLPLPAERPYAYIFSGLLI